ncbi:MAG: UDP-N-acetylmuramoyl-L-alanyl-D-glutamate--2,6-diaminopimelate ligase [Thermodesulfobacteriota bacterium]|nr:UDP-N-acetylmuramoyl-L-alanyl-D-glutamate--2,6-diaminopimelate ligase [Thermodesulfobacteriota bacterium]
MRLSYLVKDCTPVWERTLVPGAEPAADPEISSIHSIAGDVVPGGLFIAIKGFKADGHDYIDEAVQRGAVAVVAQKHVETGVKLVEVKNIRKAMASIAAIFYDNPSQGLVLTGITGTNGKTTTAWILESILNAAGCNTGVIGTVNVRYNGQIFENPVTTPESMDLQKILFDMKQAGVTHVVMEVSSHGIDLNRVDNCAFDTAVFTNLSQDHLDYHKTMKQYFKCKKNFFTKIITKGFSKASAVINIDDEKGQKIADSVNIEKYLVSRRKKVDIICLDNNQDISGISGEIKLKDSSFLFKSQLTGEFNLENILCAAGAAHALGISERYIKQGIEACRTVSGRLEKIENTCERHIFVDYAHTPDALESILKTLKKEACARLLIVFGCGGDRDKTKRPIMGKIAAKYSDIAIVTSDNPRTEEPLAIINDILTGLKEQVGRGTDSQPEKFSPSIPCHAVKEQVNRAGFDQLNLVEEGLKQGRVKEQGNKEREFHYIVEPDRKKALETAVKISKPGDIIVAAGKGHETYQILNKGTIDFDDREVLKQAVIDFLFCPGVLPESNSDYIKHSDSRPCAADNSAPKVHGLNPGENKPIPWKTLHIKKALNLNSQPGKEFDELWFAGVSTDSRIIKKDELFVALSGDSFDGHGFIDSLAEKGVKGFVAEKSWFADLTTEQKSKFKSMGCIFFLVVNTLTALGLLARFQRLRSNVKVVAITGSNGKTSTREMTARIFETRFNTLSTKGNFNNEIGLPLTLLKLSRQHQWAVVEMGMNHEGEIARLSNIAEPDIAVITNTADAHLEGLGTRVCVANAKAEIFDSIRENGSAILNIDDCKSEMIAAKIKENRNIKKLVYFGMSENASVRADFLELCQGKISFKLFHGDTDKEKDNIDICLNTPARFMVANALAASGAAFLAGISIQEIKMGLESFSPVPGRMNITKISDFNIIDDTYNANPGSVKAAMETLKLIAKANESIAVIGDMLELGTKSQELHCQAGKDAALLGISKLYAHGDMAAHLIKGAVKAGMRKERTMIGTKDEIAEDLMKKKNPGSWLLVKGSRGMKMEEIIFQLQDQNNQNRNK